MPEDTIACRDVCARHTNKDGKAYVSQHRVWDADKFYSSRAAEAAKEGGKAKCEQITHVQYLKERA